MNEKILWSIAYGNVDCIVDGDDVSDDDGDDVSDDDCGYGWDGCLFDTFNNWRTTNVWMDLI